MDENNTKSLAGANIPADVPIPAERLTRARLDAGYDNLAAACRSFGWKVGAYRHHESGARGYDVPTAINYAKAYRVSPVWLLGLEKFGAAGPQTDLPQLNADACQLLVEELLLPMLFRKTAILPPAPVVLATARTLADVLAVLRADPAALDDLDRTRQTFRTARMLRLGSPPQDD